ncbi:ABC transporter substrate-binding protein [Mesorhizobium denitrificans]|uniref:ABC transporter substrate-binding protein n=1 Tax=Mesorhizobium denitrificans TaxID=2294114 RepID=A0A371XFK9_9HYPH|nr:ABC transporter substrate-binding protein [Mesorhizobium denitrificans]RFC68012.1 ABC transporter substrate-binding protein [Mesorhizobium denitrificans]
MKRMVMAACAAAFSVAGVHLANAEGEPIVIGVASGQTGTLAPWDQGAARGAELAVEDINAKGGVLGRPLKLVVRDTKSDPSLGPTVVLISTQK